MHEKADLEIKQASEYAERRLAEIRGTVRSPSSDRYELEKAVLYGLRLGAANATRKTEQAPNELEGSR